MTPIKNPAFDLARAVQLAFEQPATDDAILSQPDIDPDAIEFWQTNGSDPNNDLTLMQSDIGSQYSGTLDDLPVGDPESTSCLHTHTLPLQSAGPHTLKRKLSNHEPNETKKKAKNRRAHQWRQRRRDEKAFEVGFHPPRSKVIDEFKMDAPSIATDMTQNDFPVAGGGYTALSGQSGEQGWYFRTLQEALAAGYRLIKWDGKSCMPLIGKDSRIFAVLAGQPDSSSYADACQRACDAMMEEGQKANFDNAQLHHKRGDFPAVNVGVTMGLGATYPTNLQTNEHTDMLQRLLTNPHIQRLAHFADAAFNLWAPNVYKSYRDHLSPLFEHLPYLRRIFPRSIYPAAAFNFGPNVFTKAHRDCMNVPAGWCAIQALGRFDPTKGGHLVLPDLYLVVEFPPGALILLPSATLTHANIPVQEGECRVSFTQFCAGGLFRYVDNGFRTESRLKKEDPKEFKRISSMKETRWKTDYERYSVLSDCVTPMSN